MIDDEVEADVRAALELAETTQIEGGALDGVTWTVDAERVVSLDPAWADETLLPADVRKTLRIGRPDLLSVAAECRDLHRWSPLLAAVNAWCFGPSGEGPWRTRRILDLADVEARLEAAVVSLDGDGPVEAYYRLNNEGHVHGWGPALFTRFLDAADRREDERALGLDQVLARAVNGLVADCDLGPADWATSEYAFFLALLHRIAREAGVPATVVEAALAAKFGSVGAECWNADQRHDPSTHGRSKSH